jgi:hypothetical protein
MFHVIRLDDPWELSVNVNCQSIFKCGMIAQEYYKKYDISDGKNPSGVFAVDSTNISIIPSGKVSLFGSGRYKTDVYEHFDRDAHYSSGKKLYVIRGVLTVVQETPHHKCVGEVISMRDGILKCKLDFPEFSDIIYEVL